MRKVKDYISLYARGVGMGAADVIPGISGGTVALITGIYEELIDTIKRIDWEALRLLSTLQLRALWKKINGAFLVPLIAGIATSILLLANLANWLMHTYPILAWSFFFGLILAASPFVLKGIIWNIGSILSGIAGAGIGYWITSLPPTHTPHTHIVLFFSGALTICAMILPGISGALILLLLGQYQFLMKAIAHFDIISIIVFALGAILGLLSFARILSWVLKKYRAVTLALLAGLMLGSLNKVWPWKLTAVTNQNIWPTTYLHKTGNDPQLTYAILLATAGILIVIGVEKSLHLLKTKH